MTNRIVVGKVDDTVVLMVEMGPAMTTLALSIDQAEQLARNIQAVAAGHAEETSNPLEGLDD